MDDEKKDYYCDSQVVCPNCGSVKIEETYDYVTKETIEECCYCGYCLSKYCDIIEE